MGIERNTWCYTLLYRRRFFFTCQSSRFAARPLIQLHGEYMHTCGPYQLTKQKKLSPTCSGIYLRTSESEIRTACSFVFCMQLPKYMVLYSPEPAPSFLHLSITSIWRRDPSSNLTGEYMHTCGPYQLLNNRNCPPPTCCSSCFKVSGS